jgi:hypothetical protein
MFLILTQMPVFNNTPNSARQYAVSTDTLHAIQILQKAPDDVAFDETTWYVSLAKNVILFLKYIYIILFFFLPNAVVHLARTPNVISLIRHLPNKISALD